jgi:hypothetical protein
METTNTRFVVIGASHAGRLASALKDMGSEVADLSMPGWKISSAAVESSIELLKEVLDEGWDGETVIIYQIFDNSSFYSIGTDGSAELPLKNSTDGKYHIIGALGMVDRDEFKQQFSLAVPLFRAGGLHKKIIVSPLMRYAIESCCDSALHCTNRGPALNKVLSEGLATLETWIDDQSFLKGIRNFLVVNPNLIIVPDNTQKKDAKTFKVYWKSGPVHMASIGYEKAMLSRMQAASWRRWPLSPSADQSTRSRQRPLANQRLFGAKAEADAEAKWTLGKKAELGVQQ